MRNYELAYWGPNTASHQIESPYDIGNFSTVWYSHTCCCIYTCYVTLNVTFTDYSEFEDKYLDEKGDEWLPLGKSFQEHVKLYMMCVYAYKIYVNYVHMLLLL